MRDLDVPVVLLHVLEPLEMEREYHRQLLHPHPLLRLLVTTTVIALELILTTQCLCVAEAAQAVRDARVLLHVHLQVEEMFVDAAHSLTVEASRLARQDTLSGSRNWKSRRKVFVGAHLKYFLHPGRLLRRMGRAIFTGTF